MARHVFMFEGLLGYGRQGWDNLCDNKPLQGNHGGNLLKCLAGSGLAFKPGGGSYRDGSLAGAGPGDTIVSYHEYGDAAKAADYARSVGLDDPIDIGGQQAFNTLIVVGHSFGGDAAWQFVSLLQLGVLFVPNLAVTFDPRSIDDHGNGDQRSNWRRNPAISVREWHNYYRPNGGILKGYPLPAGPNCRPVNDPQPDHYDHAGMIAMLWPQLSPRIDAVGTVRRYRDGDEYVA